MRCSWFGRRSDDGEEVDPSSDEVDRGADEPSLILAAPVSLFLFVALVTLSLRRAPRRNSKRPSSAVADYCCLGRPVVPERRRRTVLGSFVCATQRTVCDNAAVPRPVDVVTLVESTRTCSSSRLWATFHRVTRAVFAIAIFCRLLQLTHYSLTRRVPFFFSDISTDAFLSVFLCFHTRLPGFNVFAQFVDVVVVGYFFSFHLGFCLCVCVCACV